MTQHRQIQEFIEQALLVHVGEIAEILFFLIGAMTIIEFSIYVK